MAKATIIKDTSDNVLLLPDIMVQSTGAVPGQSGDTVVVVTVDERTKLNNASQNSNYL